MKATRIFTTGMKNIHPSSCYRYILMQYYREGMKRANDQSKSQDITSFECSLFTMVPNLVNICFAYCCVVVFLVTFDVLCIILDSWRQ